MFGVILSLVAVYLLFNVFTFKYSSSKAILVILGILLIGMLTKSTAMISVSGLFGIVVAVLYMVKHMVGVIHNIFKGVK